MLEEQSQQVWRPRVRHGKVLALWIPAEDEIIRDLYPDYQALSSRLPHRSYYALRGRAETLRLQKKRHVWTGIEILHLKRSYEHGKTRSELLAEFPWASWKQLTHVVHRHGYYRKNRRLKPTGIPIIDCIRERARAMNISMVDLDAMARCGKYFQTAGWHRSKLAGKHIPRAVLALGGTLAVNWDPLTDE